MRMNFGIETHLFYDLILKFCYILYYNYDWDNHEQREQNNPNWQ